MTLRDQLLELQEPKYMKFTAALMPGVENVLGIRLPVLRKIARQIAAGDWRTYLAEAEDFYFEERMAAPAARRPRSWSMWRASCPKSTTGRSATVSAGA